MRDYVWTDDNGKQWKIAEMSLRDLEECLRDGVTVISMDHPSECVENVLERIRIELVIRSLGL